MSLPHMDKGVFYSGTELGKRTNRRPSLRRTAQPHHRVAEPVLIAPKALTNSKIA